MSIVTNADALAEMRNLKATSTGRLRGLPASATRYDPVNRVLCDTPEPWRSQIAADITDRHAGILTATSVEYLALSDNVLIAVLTAAAHVELPDYPLTSLQPVPVVADAWTTSRGQHHLPQSGHPGHVVGSGCEPSRIRTGCPLAANPNHSFHLPRPARDGGVSAPPHSSPTPRHRRGLVSRGEIPCFHRHPPQPIRLSSPVTLSAPSAMCSTTKVPTAAR
jgi:hypothetical protein